MEEGSGWGTCVYLWWIHADIWQNQYNIVKLNNKIKFKKKVMAEGKKKVRQAGKNQISCGLVDHSKKSGLSFDN